MKQEFTCIYNVAVSTTQLKNDVADDAGNTEKPEVNSRQNFVNNLV